MKSNRLKALSSLLAFICTAFPAPLRAQSNEVVIGVRTNVVDGWVHPSKKNPAADGKHSKLYGVLSVSLVPSAEKLTKPVDPNLILKILHEEMAKEGFQKSAKGQKPDIILTVSFGRSLLTNPYLDGTGISTDGVEAIPHQNILTGDELIDTHNPGFEQKVQKATQETLFIRVTAFEFPKDPKAKMKMLWKTIIVADDPDHRDLNAIAGMMLAAGAPLFDKETVEKETEIKQLVPDGKVNVGTPEVVPDPGTASK